MTRIQRKFTSADNPDQRAANIVTLLALTGDPQIIERHRSIIAECIKVYQEVDVEARKTVKARVGQ